MTSGGDETPRGAPDARKGERDSPTISVVITSYNQRELLVEAIESVLGQTRPPDQVVVADDASTDGSREVIAGYAARHPGRITPVLSEVNRKVARNRNAGLAAATGDLVTWLDGDDVYLPRKLELESAALAADPAAGWAYSQVRVLDTATGRTALRYPDPRAGNVFEWVAGRIAHAPREPMVRAPLLRAVGGFDERLRLYEDYDLVLRLAHARPCAYVDVPGMEYRLHGAGLHAAARQRHAESLALLAENIGRMVSGDKPAARDGALRAFAYAHRVQLMGGAIQAAERGEAVRHLAAALRIRPERLCSGEFVGYVKSLLKPRPRGGR